MSILKRNECLMWHVSSVISWKLDYLHTQTLVYFSCNNVAYELHKFTRLGKTWSHLSAESLIFGRSLDFDYLPILPLQHPKGSFAGPNSELPKLGSFKESERRSNIRLYPFYYNRHYTISHCTYITARLTFPTCSISATTLFRFTILLLRNFIQRLTFIDSSFLIQGGT